MKLHKLKILPKYYDKVLSKEKMFEIRKDDRNFKVGDIIRLCEHDGKEFTGRDSLYNIDYKLNGGEYGLEEGYCILSISPYEEINKNQIENIIWHIENNREVSGDTIVLNDVLKALKNIEKRLK